MSKKKMPLLVVTGPTAVGKTRLVVALKEQYDNLEAISADSCQIFRYMNIGTAKPTAEEQEKLPHHFINIKDPDQEYNAGEYGAEGRVVFRTLYREQKIPIVVGGSGLYIRSLVDGLFQGIARDPEIKKQLQQRADEKGLQTLYKELQQVDPQTAGKLHPNDRQRIVRALEVWMTAGEPISQLRRKHHPETNIHPMLIGLNRERGNLYRIIDQRVETMVERGLIEEVSQLRNMGYYKSLQSQKTVGYQEIHEYLDGNLSLDATINLIKRNTRRFAKRQLTWFRRDKRITWFAIDEGVGWLDAKNYLSEQLDCIKGQKFDFG